MPATQKNIVPSKPDSGHNALKVVSSASKDDKQIPVAQMPKVREKYRRQFNRIVKKVEAYSKNPNVHLLRKAYHFAYDIHIDHLRKSGAPYIEHCLETANELAELKMDPITIAAGLLHDVVEDSYVPLEEVKELFGNEVALLVDGVTKISELKFKSQAEKQAENFRKMIFSMAQDLRVIMIKFADRLHNMRTLEYLSDQKAERIALETREVYAPLAHRFGIARIKWELEDLSLKFLDPDAYYDLVKKVSERRHEREKYIHKIADPIKVELEKNKISAEIRGRPKSLYSIYRKMNKRSKPFEDIYDLLAVRIVVDKVDECYFALGVVHTLFTPVHDRFKDYIATPKLNMYQSLHTTVVGPEGKMVEIQIRTEEMHKVAEIGIAAHWKYKEGKSSDDELDRYSAWLREMVDWHNESLEPEEYLDFLKTDLFRSEIFIFTPKGDLFKLPVGSTPVDFAFAVHTDVGSHCIGAKVNGKIVPLNSELKSGDSIEIITSVNQKPHQDWLTFVKTSKAKSRIKKILKEARYQDAIKLGEEILSKALKRYRLRPTKEDIKNYVDTAGFDSVDKFYADIGQGDFSVNKVVDGLTPEKEKEVKEPPKENIFERFVDRARGTAKGVRVQGMDHLLIRFAQCCHPVPGDPIIGYTSQGRGIVIHRRDCVNSLRLLENPEKIIEVSWDVGKEESFIVQLQVLAESRKDLLKDMTEFLSMMDTNIVRIDMRTENALVKAFLILEVKDLSHLTKIIKRMYRINGVLSVARDSG